MDKKEKKSLWSSIKSMFANLFKIGGQRREDLEEMIDDDIVISPTKQIAKNFFENKLGVTGLVAFILIFVVVFGVTSVRPYNPFANATVLDNLAPGRKYLNIEKEIQGKPVQEISSGTSYSVALDENGKVHFWGQRPDKNFKVEEIVNKTKNSTVVSLASGDKFVVAVTKDNKFIGVGENTFGQTELPLDVLEDIGSDTIVKVGAGKRFTAIVTESGKLYTWGSTLENNLDNIPKEIQGRVKDIAIGQFNIIVTLDDGSLRIFGQGGNEVSQIPTALTDGSVKVAKVGMAETSVMALDVDGNVYTWGAGGAFQSVPEFDGKIVDIDASLSSFNAVSDKGTVYAWGQGKFNLLEIPASVQKQNTKRIYSDHFQTYAVDDAHKIEGWGNKGFVLGTDHLGRSVGERLLYGGRISLTVGAIAMIISTVIGVVVGLVAGFYGKWVDNLLMRIAEVISAFPFLPLAITLSAMLPMETSQSQRLAMIMVIMGVISWPGIARLVRGQILAEREKDFVLAARALGLKEKTIIIRHILPSVFNFIIVNMTLGYASSLLTEAGLSYLGFGVRPPSPSWGNMLNGAANTTVIEKYWWQWLLPALCVMFTALSVNLIGDALRDAMDPKSNQK